MRATRVGGSFSSCARASGAAKLKRPAKHSSKPRLLLPVIVIVFMTNPLSSVWTLAALALLMRRSSRWERNIYYHGSHWVEHRHGKEVAHERGHGPRCICQSAANLFSFSKLLDSIGLEQEPLTPLP